MPRTLDIVDVFVVDVFVVDVFVLGLDYLLSLLDIAYSAKYILFSFAITDFRALAGSPVSILLVEQIRIDSRASRRLPCGPLIESGAHPRSSSNVQLP